MMQPLFGGRRLPTHATGREYSRLKVPNVLANSNAESQRPRRSRASRPRQTLRRLGRRGHSQFLSGTTAGWHCTLSWVPLACQCFSVFFTDESRLDHQNVSNACDVVLVGSKNSSACIHRCLWVFQLKGNPRIRYASPRSKPF